MAEEKLEEQVPQTDEGSAEEQASSPQKFGFKKPDLGAKISLKTKEWIEIIAVIAFLAFVFKLKADGVLDNPVGVLGNAFGF